MSPFGSEINYDQACGLTRVVTLAVGPRIVKASIGHTHNVVESDVGRKLDPNASTAGDNAANDIPSGAVTTSPSICAHSKWFQTTNQPQRHERKG